MTLVAKLEVRSISAQHVGRRKQDMLNLREYDVVRVVRLLEQERSFDGTESVRRAPRIGDVGTIIHEYDPSHSGAPVVVEMVDEEGMTVWLADFVCEELELVPRQ
jgi:hypothetical protein